jgi:hypothetical protein
MGTRAADALRGSLAVAFWSSRWAAEDLADDEFFWEPVDGCWSIRRHGDARSDGWGTGEWRCEDPWPHPDPPPVTTIGWRLVHLCAWTDVYRDWTFGDAQLALPEMEVPGDAASAVAWLHDAQARFTEAVGGLDDDDLAQLRPAHFGGRLPVQWLAGAIAREHIHHGAEIGVLRDLRRGHARTQPAPLSS